MKTRRYFTKRLFLCASVMLLLPLSACMKSQHESAKLVQVGDNGNAGVAMQSKEKVRLEGLRFKIDGASLRGNSKPILLAAADILKSAPSTTFYVDVHCDRRGSRSTNLRLGQERAENVKAYLEAQGVPSERMIARGFGTANSSTKYSSPMHLQNSRVELIPLTAQTIPISLSYSLSGANG